MTFKTFEEAGYTRDTKFIVVKEDGYFPIGTVLRVRGDIDTVSFRLTDEREWWWYGLSDIGDTINVMEGEPTLIKGITLEPTTILKFLWDAWDLWDSHEDNEGVCPLPYHYEDIHAELNRRGEGSYCAGWVPDEECKAGHNRP